MPPKTISFFSLIFLLLLLLVHPSRSARPQPGFNTGATRHEENHGQVDGAEHGCEGIGEECLMRRTLAAQTDYIYTQEHNP
ncbi:hypothetical protein MLD38_023277 [Melastoma candidum]|uniref:Uncharacterized protein n=1 Tax=Melastoma candidum TaxID=119954 RepID=A0ACB9QQY0_9MYRT|nr:hypothetical protein MLD38_023277 [Melastoma candidum]